MRRAELVNAFAYSCALAMMVMSWTPSAAVAFATPRGDVPFVSNLVRVQNDRLKYADMESYAYWELEDDEEYDQFLENKKLADQGDTEAQYRVGHAFFTSIVVETNVDLGIDYLTKAAEKGHIGAQSYLGGVYYNSLHGRQDYEQAHYWSEKAVKAGDLIAIHRLGGAYLLGNGVAQDVPKAVSLFERASRAGWNPSRVQLAKMMMSGEHIEKNLDQGIELLNVAAEANSQQAHYELAILRTQGIGMPMDIPLAIEHFEKASSYLDSKYRLALIYIFGIAGKANEKSASLVSEVLTRESNAQYIYGLLHEFDLIYTRNIETSLKYYGFAARNGHKSAEERMRLLKNPSEDQILPDEIEPLIFSVTPPEITYIAGSTIENNPEEKDYKERAVKLFRMAADQGHAYAEMKLGSCYRRGFGVEKDENQALYWLERAAAKGVQEADLMLKNRDLMNIKVLGPVPPVPQPAFGSKSR